MEEAEMALLAEAFEALAEAWRAMMSLRFYDSRIRGQHQALNAAETRRPGAPIFRCGRGW